MRTILVLLILLFAINVNGQNLLFTESFDSGSLAGNGWFDDVTVPVSTTTKYSGLSSMQISFASGATQATGIGAVRRQFTPSANVYVSMYWYFNANWVGSGQAYQPHIIHMISDLDDPWGGLNRSYLAMYCEVYGVTPRLILQDGLNVNTSYGTPPNDLTTTTENRDVGGCNGTLTGSDAGNYRDCYDTGGGVYANGRGFNGVPNFTRSAWHRVQVYYQMNTISNNVAQPDGIMWMKVDGSYVIYKTNIVFRTNQHPTIKFAAFIFAPYIGDGSPQAQDMFIDQLEVYDGAPPEGEGAKRRFGTIGRMTGILK